MTQSADIVRPAIDTEGPRSGSLEARASLAFKILAAFGIFGVVLATFPGTIPVSTLLTVMVNGAAAALAAVYVAEAIGLDRRRPWAVAAARPLLIVLAASGLYLTLVAWGEGRIRVPFDVGLAIWAWLGAPDATPIASQERRSVSCVGAGIALIALMSFGQQLFGWGGLLDVHEPDLRASIAADCGEPGVGPPETITFEYDWAWGSGSPLPSGTDIVVVGWTGADAEGNPLYVIDEIPESGLGIRPGFGGYPSTPMAGRVAKESTASFRWGIDLSRQGLTPGRTALRLMRAREIPPGPNPLTITATYIHLGLWRHDAPRVICSW
jgi:hypothetical protein